MDRIAYLARIAVLRALGFVTLGVGTMIVGLSFDPALALKCGAALTAITAAVLFYKAATAANRDYRRTEVWMMLDGKADLGARTQEIIGDVLRREYVRFGEWTAGVATAQWLLSIAFRLA